MHDTSNEPVHVVDWLTVHNLADLLRVRVGHLRALVARREIPFARVGRLIRFHWPTVQRWVTEHASTPPTSSGTRPSSGSES